MRNYLAETLTATPAEVVKADSARARPPLDLLEPDTAAEIESLPVPTSEDL